MGRDMQWYVYLVTIPAVFFLGQVIVELIVRPVRTVLNFRRHALAQLAAFRNMALPGPRELAVSSAQIRIYDQTVRNVREAQRCFAELGAQLLAFGESEPVVRAFMAVCGLDILRAGDELICLSEIYSAAKIDSDELRRALEDAHLAVTNALGVRRRPSGRDELTRIRLEPMYLPRATARRRARPLSRPRHISSPRPLRARRARPATG